MIYHTLRMPKTLLWLLITMVTASSVPAASSRVYIGTYTRGISRGIYTTTFDERTGRLGEPVLAAETVNPSFLAIHPKKPYLYAAGESGTSGGVIAFAIQPDATLKLINTQSSGGSGPCHLSLDASGRTLLVANYGSGSIAALPVAPDGSLGAPSSTIQHSGSSINQRRQSGPHAHFIIPDPGNKRALVCDLGMDQVLVYDLDAAKSVLASRAPSVLNATPGAGPRHLTFGPEGRYVFVVNELNSTVSAMCWNRADGKLEALQSVSTLPGGAANPSNTCAGIQVHPSGRWLFASNRGDDSIAIFSVNRKNGSLEPAGHCSSGGKTPRHFAVSPGGKWVLAENQGSDSIVSLAFDSRTGRLQPTGHSIKVGAPVCLVFSR